MLFLILKTFLSPGWCGSVGRPGNLKVAGSIPGWGNMSGLWAWFLVGAYLFLSHITSVFPKISKSLNKENTSIPHLLSRSRPCLVLLFCHLGLSLLDSLPSGQGHKERGKDCNDSQEAAGTRAGL